MAYTHKITTGYTSDMGAISSTVETFVGSAQVGVDVAVVAGAVNALEAIAITQANIVSVCIVSDKALTLKTNSSGSPQETLSLVAGSQVVWTTNSTHACPFSDDITAFYLSNAGVAPARFRVECLLSS